MFKDFNVLALVKDSERYVFLYDDESVGVFLQNLGRYALDKELSFTWYDAAVLSQKVRKLREEELERIASLKILSNLEKEVNQESIPLNPETCLELNIEFLKSIGLT